MPPKYKTEYIDYIDGSTTCEGFVAYNESAAEPRPCVLISHAWSGQSDSERRIASKLAESGYVGFALDNYGKGKRGSSPEENTALMQPFMNDRKALRTRLLAGVTAAENAPNVDKTRIAAIGFCFGGLCAIDLARSADRRIKGVVSFHGLLGAPEIGEQEAISAKVLILHGWDDPMATPQNVVEIGKELTSAKADWQLLAFGQTMHAFMNPAANAPQSGLLYNERSAGRAWQAMQNFLEELFAPAGNARAGSPLGESARIG